VYNIYQDILDNSKMNVLLIKMVEKRKASIFYHVISKAVCTAEMMNKM